jgi:hypothetical protein
VHSYTELLVHAVLNSPNSVQNAADNYHRFTAKDFRSMTVNGNHRLSEYDVMLTGTTMKKIDKASCHRRLLYLCVLIM